MKTEIDSNQKKLPYPIIITQTIIRENERLNNDKKEIASDLLQFESLVQKPDVKMTQINNTVFLVKTNQNSKACTITVFNMDTKENYANNIVKIIDKLTKNNIKRGAFGGASSDDLEAYQMAKQKSTIPMGISQTKDKIICIFDASITLNKREK